jgi:hypothetical protein
MRVPAASDVRFRVDPRISRLRRRHAGYTYLWTGSTRFCLGSWHEVSRCQIRIRGISDLRPSISGGKCERLRCSD